MSRKLVFSLILSVLAFVGFSQNLSILTIDNQDVTNDTFTVNIEQPFEDLSIHFLVRNNDNVDYGVKVQFNILSLVDGVGYSFCWDQCYASVRDGFTSGAITIPANSTDTSDFTVDYSPEGNAGISFFKFGFFVDGMSDTTYLFVKFVLQQSNVESMQEQVKVFPNPASDYVILDLPVAGDYKVEIYNQFGQRVLFKNVKSQKVNLRLDLDSGIYFLKVSSDKMELSRKLIVL